MSRAKSPDLIVVCGMLRSGSTLVYQLVCAILERVGAVRRVGFLESGQSWAPGGPDFSSSVVKLHHFDEQLAALVAASQARAIYTYRDPRDGVVSAMRQFDIPFDKALEWYEYAVRVGAKWESLPYTFSLSYESLAKDLVQLVAVLSANIDTDIDPGVIASIAAEHTRNNQHSRASQVTKGSYDPVNLLHHGHISLPDEGDALFSLSAEQTVRIEESLGQWMRAHGYSVPGNSGRLSRP